MIGVIPRLAHLRVTDIMGLYETGHSVSVQSPLLVVGNGSYTFQGKVTDRRGDSGAYICSATEKEFETLVAFARTHTVRKEGV